MLVITPIFSLTVWLKDQYGSPASKIDILFFPPPSDPPCVPCEARKLLASMDKKGLREATFLQERIDLLDHIEALQFGPPIKTLPVAEVRAHCQALVDQNLSLPYDLRCKILEKYANQYLLGVKDAESNSGPEVDNYTAKFIEAVAVWKPTLATADPDELTLTASFIFEGMEEDIALAAKSDSPAPADGQKELPEQQYKARRFVSHKAILKKEAYIW